MYASYPISEKVYFFGFAISFLVSLVITKIIIKVLGKSIFLKRLLDIKRESAEKEIIHFGGIGVVLSFFLTIWLFYAFGSVDEKTFHLFIVITISTGLMFLLGICDDLFHVSPRTKLAIQIVIALILFLGGFKIAKIGDWIELKYFAFLLTSLWVVGITNAINLIDGEDGLASGVTLLACLTLFFVYLNRDIYEASFLSIVLFGSVLGFFIFNFPPAKIILGDTGSLPIGLLASLITLLPLSQGFSDEIYYLIPVVVLLLPIIDTSISFFRRIFKGKSPFSKDKEHLHHRLVRLGLSPFKSVAILFAVSLYFDFVSLVPVYNINLVPHFIPLFFVFLIFNILLLLSLLRFFEKRNDR